MFHAVQLPISTAPSRQGSSAKTLNYTWTPVGRLAYRKIVTIHMHHNLHINLNPH